MSSKVGARTPKEWDVEDERFWQSAGNRNANINIWISIPMIGVIFNKGKRGPVPGWTAATAAYGAYLIPEIFAIQIEAKSPLNALYGFAVYCASCLIVNWWFCDRKNSEVPC